MMNTAPNHGLERICQYEFKNMAECYIIEKSMRSLLTLKGQIGEAYSLKYQEYFFEDCGQYQYSFYYGKSGRGYRYFLKGKCEIYFEKHSKEIIRNFLSETYITMENAVIQTNNFDELWDVFMSWFDERRNRFMENMDAQIQKWKHVISENKPQSHGGVANLLKVLTKTMEKQGADIQSIAKVQYTICVQAGIYIPDEFIRDVAVTLDIEK